MLQQPPSYRKHMDKPILNQNIHPMTLPDGRVMLLNQQTRKAFSIGADEYELVKLCDGKTKQTDICQAVHGFSPVQAALLIEKLVQLDILTENSKKRRKLWDIKIPLYAPSVYKNRQKELPIKIASALLLSLSPMVFISGVYASRAIEPCVKATYSLHPLWYILIFIISATLHELSHALMACRYGACVVEMGIGFQKILPCLYTSIVGISAISSKKAEYEFILPVYS